MADLHSLQYLGLCDEVGDLSDLLKDLCSKSAGIVSEAALAHQRGSSPYMVDIVMNKFVQPAAEGGLQHLVGEQGILTSTPNTPSTALLTASMGGHMRALPALQHTAAAVLLLLGGANVLASLPCH